MPDAKTSLNILPVRPENLLTSMYSGSMKDTRTAFSYGPAMLSSTHLSGGDRIPSKTTDSLHGDSFRGRGEHTQPLVQINVGGRDGNVVSSYDNASTDKPVASDQHPKSTTDKPNPTTNTDVPKSQRAPVKTSKPPARKEPTMFEIEHAFRAPPQVRQKGKYQDPYTRRTRNAAVGDMTHVEEQKPESNTSLQEDMKSKVSGKFFTSWKTWQKIVFICSILVAIGLIVFFVWFGLHNKKKKQDEQTRLMRMQKRAV